MAWKLMTFECDPLHARFWFGWRRLMNWGIVLVVYVPLVVIIALLPFRWPLRWILDLTIIVPFFFLYFYLLEKRPIRFKCPHCGGCIDSNTAWICGNKGCRNDNVDEFPFVNRCEHCHNYPKSYECHHCGQLVFLTEDRQESGYARCANLVPGQKSTQVLVNHEKRIGVTKRNIEFKGLKKQERALDVEIKGYKDALAHKPPRLKTLEEKYREAVKNEDDANRLHAEIDREFLHDEAERTRRHLLVDAIMRDGGFIN